MAIGCWLIYSRQKSPQEVIKLAQEKRGKVLSKNSQKKFLFRFEKCNFEIDY